MKVPKTFISSDKKEIDPSKIETTTMSLEDFIPENINGMRYEEKIITGLVNSYYVYNPDFKRLAEDYPIVDKMAIAKYDKGNKKIVLMEYKKQQDLTNSLRQMSEYLQDYHMVERHDYIKKRMLFKNNILAWLDGDKCFIESAAFHYKNLGFEPFN